MSLEAAIVARLNAVTAVTDLTSTRIYADTLPDGTTHPAIVYQLISTIPFDSNISTDGGIFQSRIQLTLVSDTKSETITLMEAVKTALIRHKGASGGSTFIDTRIDDISDQAYDIETNQTARIMDFIVYWN